jgi:hypothetical protein
MDRLDLELYADRLARLADRLADEVAAARLRLAFAEIERGARAVLGAADAALLEAIGAMAEQGGADADRRLVERRSHQLAIVGRYRRYVDDRIADVQAGREASATSRPPS